MEVFSQRLDLEYGAQVVVTTPSVPYKLLLKYQKASKKLTGEELIVCNPSHWLEKTSVEKYLEPYVQATIITPATYLSAVLHLCHSRRGQQLDSVYIDQGRLKMEWSLPLNEVVLNFFDKLKSLTSGYASFDYENAGYQESDLAKIDILLNGNPVPELSFISHTSKARDKSKEVALNLKEELPRQQFNISIQAVRGGRC